MKSISVFLLVLISTVLLSCSDDNSNSPTNSVKDLWPMTVGSRWVMEKTTFNKDGSVKSTENDTLTAIDTITYNGNKYVRILTADTDTLVYGYFDNWLHKLEKDGDSWVDEQWLKYPVSQGEEYTKEDGDKTVYTVLSLSGEVIVPAGSFMCIKYEAIRYKDSDVPSSKEYNYFCPGFGWIKYEYFRYNSDSTSYLSFRYELVDFSIKY